MITVLLIFVFAVVLFGWLTVGLVCFAIAATEITGLMERCRKSSDQSISSVGDTRFLRDLGIRP